MAQISLYVNDAELEILREKAKKQNLSLSRYVIDVLREMQEKALWPPAFFSLYGALAEDDGFEEPADEPFDRKPLAPLN